MPRLSAAHANTPPLGAALLLPPGVPRWPFPLRRRVQVYASKQAAAASPEATDPCERPPAVAARPSPLPAAHQRAAGCRPLASLNALPVLCPFRRLRVQQRDAVPLHQPLLPGWPALRAAGVRGDAQARVRRAGGVARTVPTCRAVRVPPGPFGCTPLLGADCGRPGLLLAARLPQAAAVNAGWRPAEPAGQRAEHGGAKHRDAVLRPCGPGHRPRVHQRRLPHLSEVGRLQWLGRRAAACPSRVLHDVGGHRAFDHACLPPACSEMAPTSHRGQVGASLEPPCGSQDALHPGAAGCFCLGKRGACMPCLLLPLPLPLPCSSTSSSSSAPPLASLSAASSTTVGGK